MQEIVDEVVFYYKTDFDYDVREIQEKQNKEKLIDEEQYFLWIARSHGTCLFSERELFYANSWAQSACREYAHREKFFFIDVKDQEKLTGNIYYQTDSILKYGNFLTNDYPLAGYSVEFKSGCTQLCEVNELGTHQFIDFAQINGGMSKITRVIAEKDRIQLDARLAILRQERELYSKTVSFKKMMQFIKKGKK